MSNRPTPEQQAATARRYPGQRALVAAEVVQEPSSRQTVPPVAEKPPPGFRKRIWHWARWTTFWVLIILIVAAIGAHQVDGPHFNTNPRLVPTYPAIYPLANRATIVLVVALGVLVAFWLLVGMCAYVRLIWRMMDEAVKPNPSLTAIDQQLRAEGHDPSIADVVAMHQYLTSQRNEAIVVTGALVIGPQLLARQARGRSLL